MGCANVEQLITDHIDLWTSAIENKKSSGRGSSKKQSLHGIKKLRELILELAVRGKLVPQDSNDEPASVLLERIAEERDQLAKEKKVKKPKKLPCIMAKDIPHELPTGWVWSRLNDLCSLENGDRSKNYPNKSVLVDEGIPFVNAGHLQDGLVNKSEMTFITQERFDLLRSGKFQVGDILYCLRGSLGKSAIVEDLKTGAIASSLVIVRTTKGIQQSYLLKYFDAPLSEVMIKQYDNGTAQPNLSATDLCKFLVPVPPVDEQQRIVAKVDELMALCDQLEEQTENNIEAHQVLVETLLGTLTQSQNADELAENWERVAEHFDTLFTTEHSIDQLKQTILQLAVMGKLVPQDPNDEPASVLLEKIAAEKEGLIKEKKIKKQKSLPPISDEEKPFSLPEGWEWCRFSILANEVATGPFGSMINKKEYIDGGVPLINPSHMNNSQIQEDSSISVTYEKAQELSTYRIRKGDVVMARRGEMGRCALVTEREHNWLCGTGSFVLRFGENVSRPYILLLFRTTWIKEYLGGNSIGTTMVNLNHGILNKMPLLVPPVSEQHRIVSKVDQLMSFCDELKARLQQAQQTQLSLTEGITDQALKG
jgi:type I restriction enzyme S subunit